MGQATSQGVGRLFTPKNSRAYDQLKWAKTDVLIEDPQNSEPVLEQKDVEFPEGWSQEAINITAHKYFDGTLGQDDRESSLKQLIDRVVDTITRQGQQEGYFDSSVDTEDFREELKFVLASQKATFNSTVWTNIGSPNRTQQASNSFILSVQDTMPSILNWYAEESVIFKGGNGSGVNLSSIRSSVEPLGTGGTNASGPLSFMRGADTSVGAININNKTNSVSQKVILDVNHPDIEEFIWTKATEEHKARDLESMGWNLSHDGKDSFSMPYKKTNMSVRVTDEFMQAAEADKDWRLEAVTSGQPIKVLKAREVFEQIAKATWECSDPDIQFDSAINLWNTTPNAGHINASSAYGEYMHLDDSACNLATINLLSFLNDDFSFAIEDFKHTVDLILTAQEILVDYSEYPTKKIAKTTRAYRELGIGYANLGALLMVQGLPYDSEDGRAQAAAITALMTGHAYAVSAKLARQVGPFSGYNKDREGMLKILRMHREAVSKIDVGLVSEDLLDAAASAWEWKL